MFENFDGIRYTGNKINRSIDNSLNCHSPIACCNPSLIFHPDILFYVRRFGHMDYLENDTECRYVYRGESDVILLRNLLDIKLKYCSLDNYTFFVCGRKQVVFPVPCGHCTLCLSLKTSEYAFRSIAETISYPEDPLYLTLTYNDHCLPSSGVSVIDMQNYFKRLRNYLFRMGLPTDFRYLCVAEYGAKNGRPHYHVELWNYPVKYFNTLTSALNSLYQGWMYYVTNEDGSRKMVYSKRKKKWFPVRKCRGIIKILPIKEGCTAYITKYFRKEGHNKLNYPGKPFLISSRKNGGIGSHYLKTMTSFVHNNFNLSHISLLDPISEKEFRFPITGYLKRLFYPVRSVIYSKYLDLLKSAVYFHDNMIAISHFVMDLTREKLSPNTFYFIRFIRRVVPSYFKVERKEYYLKHYSFYRFKTSFELMEIFNSYYRQFRSLFNLTIVKDLLVLRQKWLIREKFSHFKNDINRKFYYYCIPEMVYTNAISYEKYKVNCLF